MRKERRLTPCTHPASDCCKGEYTDLNPPYHAAFKVNDIEHDMQKSGPVHPVAYNPVHRIAAHSREGESKTEKDSGEVGNGKRASPVEVLGGLQLAVMRSMQREESSILSSRGSSMAARNMGNFIKITRRLSGEFG